MRTLFATLAVVVILLVTVVFADYFESLAIGHNDGGKMTPYHNGRDKITIEVQRGSLDEYLNVYGLDSEEVTVDLTIDEDGLIFEFAPSGAFFTKSLLLTITGDLMDEDAALVVDGEEVEYTAKRNGKSIIYYIHHFSNYYYDDY